MRIAAGGNPLNASDANGKMDTGYWVEDSSIYGSSGYTGFRIDRRRQIVGPQGYTRHWIYRDQIYSSNEGNTGFCINKGRIVGPTPDLPWQLSFKKRVQRAMARKRSSGSQASY